MIFDVKFDGRRRKARFVAGGEDDYSRVVVPEAIPLGIFVVVPNDLKVITANIGNAYLHAKTNGGLSEKYMVSEFQVQDFMNI